MKLTIELSMGDVEILQSERFLTDAIMNFYFKSVSNSILCYNINVGEWGGGGGGNIATLHSQGHCKECGRKCERKLKSVWDECICYEYLV